MITIQCAEISKLESLIPRGRENAIQLQSLSLALGISERDVRSLLASARASGSLILSSTVPPGGYFLPDTLPEIRDYVQSMKSRARNTARSYAAANRKLHELEEGHDDSKE